MNNNSIQIWTVATGYIILQCRAAVDAQTVLVKYSALIDLSYRLVKGDKYVINWSKRLGKQQY